MKTASAGLIALLASGNAIGADVYTITLASGQVLRYTSFDMDVKNGADTWSCSGPVLERGSVTSKTGFEVSSMDFAMKPKATDLVLGMSWAQAARVGALDGARLLVQRAFMAGSAAGTGQTLADVTANGLLWVFGGQLSAPKFGRGGLEFTVESDMKLLNVKMPRQLDLPGCRHTLFDAGCTLNEADYDVATSAASGSTDWVLNCAVTEPAGWYDLGRVVFTSGSLAGLARSIRRYTPGSPAALLLLTPLPAAPGIGDTFNVYPGCDKRQATCGNRVTGSFTVDTGTDKLLSTGHLLVDGRRVKLTSSGTLPAPFAAGTVYHVVNATANDLQLAATYGGSAINITTAGSGTHSIRDIGRFDNLDNFGGEPYIPPPETAV